MEIPRLKDLCRQKGKTDGTETKVERTRPVKKLENMVIIEENRKRKLD